MIMIMLASGSLTIGTGTAFCVISYKLLSGHNIVTTLSSAVLFSGSPDLILVDWQPGLSGVAMSEAAVPLLFQLLTHVTPVTTQYCEIPKHLHHMCLIHV